MKLLTPKEEQKIQKELQRRVNNPLCSCLIKKDKADNELYLSCEIGCAIHYNTKNKNHLLTLHNMKQLFLGLALTLISALSFACHIDPVGYCNNDGTVKSYFITRVFNPNSIYKFWITGTSDTLLTFTTGANVSDSIFSLPVDAGASIEMSYNYIGSDFIEHYDPSIAANYEYAGCGALPVRISNFYVQKRNNNTVISFDAGNETDIKLYNIKASVDGRDWVQIGSIKATGARHYSIPISAGLVASFIPLMLLFVNKKKWAVLASIALAIVFYSCKKEAIDKQNQDYQFFQIESVDNAGVSILSEIKTL